MLYTTTRDDTDAYTAYRALHEELAPNGGGFTPFRLPIFSNDDIALYCTGSFSKTVADILNKFFACRLTAWDVDFAIGRNTIKLSDAVHSVVIAELWHNPVGNYNHICNSLFQAISGIESSMVSAWFKIAVHISVLFGIYAELYNSKRIAVGNSVDLSIAADNLEMPIAAIYARKMGLPIGTIILTSGDNSALWDLIHLGGITANAASVDVAGYERLIYALLGVDCARNFINALNDRKAYYVDEEQLPIFNNGLFCSVTGRNRGTQNLNAIFKNNSYILDPTTALCVSGLQDYRAKFGERKLTLTLSCVSPMNCLSEISEATGMSPEKISSLLKKT